MGKKRIKDKTENVEEKSNKKSMQKGIKKAKVAKTKKRKNVNVAKVYINCTYNNTILTFTDYSGNVIANSSCGCVGFRGSKKGTAFAATKAAYDSFEKASKYGVVEASVIVKGIGMGRHAAIKGLRTAGLIITSLSDKTPVPHNGCRPRKKPRGS
jgi:small subunit ribosomal protein S11